MKVAYNACYGGFGLSPLALTEFAKRKGLTLYWYRRYSFSSPESLRKFKRVDGVPDRGGLSTICFTQDTGEDITVCPEESYYYPSLYEDCTRTDPDLIAVIEMLGEKANGECSDLAIKEVPDGAQFEITGYDGWEDVVPPRMSW